MCIPFHPETSFTVGLRLQGHALGAKSMFLRDVSPSVQGHQCLCGPLSFSFLVGELSVGGPVTSEDQGA